jgi:glycosyltransferase involved in cell wall biosynthesis
MKLIYSYTTDPTAGSSIHIDSFTKAYRALGETVVEKGRYDELCKEDKRTWSLVKRIKVRLDWLLNNLRNLLALFFLAQKVKPDALLFRFNPMHSYLFSIIGLSFFYPVILEVNAVRSIELSLGRPKISDFFDWISLKLAKRSFVVSGRLKQHLVEHYSLDGSKISVIENGVDVDEFNPAISGAVVRASLGLDKRFVIGFVGSFRSWHGIDHLINLAEALSEELPQALFLLVGDGPDRGKYEAWVREKGLAANFKFIGHIPHSEVVPHLAAMDVVMAPHSAASFPTGFYGSALKIFEYMAMAKPVIAAPMGQIREVIEDGASGYLIESEDTDKLKRTLLMLYHDRNLRERLGKNARAKVIARYAWKTNAEKVQQLIKEAICA